MRTILNYLFEHKHLTRTDAKEVLTNMALGKYSDPEIAAFLTVYLMRSISIEELAGFRDALLELCIRVDLSEFDPIDLCGTGGDNKNTFNISTLASFVVAGAGYKVAKHGNYGVSSGCGSSNVLEYLGYKFTSDIELIKRSIDKSGICFLHAPLFNPAMKNVAPVRKQLRVKTFFNMLGPMVNPSFPDKQVVGVFSLDLARMYYYLYQSTGKSYRIYHTLDGYDEISLTSEVKVLSNKGESILFPHEFGFDYINDSHLSGGQTVKEAADIFISVLTNKSSVEQKNVVLANAALAIQCADSSLNLQQAVAKARGSLEGGLAYQSFNKLVEIN